MVCGVALGSLLLPGVVETTREGLSNRLNYPLTYPTLLRIPLTTAEGRVYGALRKLRDELQTR